MVKRLQQEMLTQKLYPKSKKKKKIKKSYQSLTKILPKPTQETLNRTFRPIVSLKRINLAVGVRYEVNDIEEKQIKQEKVNTLEEDINAEIKANISNMYADFEDVLYQGMEMKEEKVVVTNDNEQNKMGGNILERDEDNFHYNIENFAVVLMPK